MPSVKSKAGPDGGVGIFPSTSTTTEEAVDLCDPVANSGCSVNEGCFLRSQPLQAECAPIPQRIRQHEDTCTSSEDQGCGPGFSCLTMQDTLGPRCFRVCEPGDDSVCNELDGTSPRYVCSKARGLRYGVCVGVGATCDPLRDACAAEENCSIRANRLGCMEAGLVSLGGDCGSDACQKGLVCVDLTTESHAKCMQPCKPNRLPCDDGDICTRLHGFEFGVCQSFRVRCDPLAPMCGPTEGCFIRGLDVACGAPGSVKLGGECSVEGCALGSVCLRLSSDSTPVCRLPCAKGTKCKDQNLVCVDVGLPFGVCAESI